MYKPEIWWLGYQKLYTLFFLSGCTIRLSQMAKIKYDYWVNRWYKSRFAKTGASRIKYNFWNPHIRRVIWSISFALQLGNETSDIGQTIHVCNPWAQKKKLTCILIWSEQFDFSTYCIAAIWIVAIILNFVQMSGFLIFNLFLSTHSQIYTYNIKYKK